MKPIGKIFGAPFKAIGKAFIKKPKKADQPTIVPQVTRDDANIIRDREDELRRRRGGAADILTGLGGAEPASATAKTVLG